jgi:hypothetical protein
MCGLFIETATCQLWDTGSLLTSTEYGALVIASYIKCSFWNISKYVITTKSSTANIRIHFAVWTKKVHHEAEIN